MPTTDQLHAAFLKQEAKVERLEERDDEIRRDVNGLQDDRRGITEAINGVKLEISELKGQVKSFKAGMEGRIDALEDKVDIQNKVTWALLFLVISGLVGVAFSVWGKGI
tara:strand:- start:6090 stop:6416 length:327 start_codon:yes stop_codon:yes gene_type:complete